MTNPPGAPIRGPVTLAEVTAGLIWPTLFRAVPLALQPTRIALGFLAVAILMGVGTLFDAIAGPIVQTANKAVGMSRIGKPRGLFTSIVDSAVETFHTAIARSLRLDLGGAWDALSRFFLDVIPAYARIHTGAFLALLLVFIALVIPARIIIFGAIARMTACQVAISRSVSISEGLRFAAARWKSLVAAILIPPVLITLLCLVMAVGGLALFRVPVLNVIGGLLFGLFLLGGALVLLLGVGFMFAAHLTAPAIATDGADAIDALQRAYAYTIGRPGRLLIYTAILIALGVVTYAFVALGVATAINWTGSLAGTWSGADELAGHVKTLDFTLPAPPLGLTGTAKLTQSFIGLWERVLLALLAGAVFSYHDCASTLLYLLLRRVNDEQDIEDILLPEAAA